LQCFHRSASAQIFLVAHIERERNLFPESRCSRRRGLNFSDRCENAAIFCGQNKFRRARKRVVPQIHRHGSGVAGDTRNSTRNRLCPAMAVTTPTGKLFFSSTGPVDMDFPRNR